MIAVKTVQLSRHCQVAAFRYTPQSPWRCRPGVHQRCVHDHDAARRWRGGVAVTSTTTPSLGRYTNFHVQESSIFESPILNQRRTFSKFSTDEVVIQDPDPLSPPSDAAPKTAATAAAIASTSISSTKTTSSEMSQRMQSQEPQQVRCAEDNSKLLSDLQGAHELFHQIFTEGWALIQNNKKSTASDEIVAMVDYFMILVNSLDLERSLELVQSLQEEKHHQQQQPQLQSENDECHDETVAVAGKLSQAVKSMSQLHYIFLNMVESSLPLLITLPNKKDMDDEQFKVDGNKNDNDMPSFNKELHSALTVGRALQLSRRAEELGMPVHRPLYQRLALGIVATSEVSREVSENTVEHQIDGVATDSDDKDTTIKDPTDNVDHQTEGAAADSNVKETTIKEPTSSSLPGKFQQAKGHPLTLELMGVFQNARSALDITCQDQLQQLAEDLFAEPFLILLKQKQYEECMALMRQWHGLFGGGSIAMMNLLGEQHTMTALEVVKGWSISFGEDVETNKYAMELAHLMEVALAKILKDEKQSAEDLARLIWESSLQNDDDEDYGNSFEAEGEDVDSDFDDDDDFDYSSDGEEALDMPTPTELSRESNSDPHSSSVLDSDDKIMNTTTMTHRAGDSISRAQEENEWGNEDEESTIIQGLSDKEARLSIYLRNGVDWILPDVVPQLQDWNKGNQLTFTAEFERYLGRQITKEDGDEDY